jgi:hypothetical protein
MQMPEDKQGEFKCGALRRRRKKNKFKKVII